MFAITGVTGQVGGAVAETLLAQGCAVRAVMRDPAKAEQWARRGCTVAIADITDADAVARAFDGAEGVFVLVPPLFDPSPGWEEVRGVIAAVAPALRHAKPARAVVLSTVGAQATETNLLSQLGLVERELGEVGLPVAFLRAAWFMENAAGDVESARAAQIDSFLQPAHRPIPMVATADVGALGARLLRESWTGRRIVELEGPARVSPDDLATGFAALLGRPVAVHTVPRAEWERRFRDQGMRNPLPRMRMLDGFNEGWIDFEGGDAVETVRGQTRLEAVLEGLLQR